MNLHDSVTLFEQRDFVPYSGIYAKRSQNGGLSRKNNLWFFKPRDFCPQTDSRADWPILTRRKDVRSPFCHLYPKNLCSRKIRPTCKDKDKKKSKRTIFISTGWRMNQSKWLLKGTVLTVQISWHFKVLNYLKSTCYILK